ncbi:MAG TPA: hypothetical protein VMB83_08555 [Roseiarcus sp.]|nr:hypothetical protein [Roseiarcus sp.]
MDKLQRELSAIDVMGCVAYYLTLYRKGGSWLIAGHAQEGLSPATTEWADVCDPSIPLTAKARA